MTDFTGVTFNPAEAFVEKTKSTLQAKEDRFVEENRLHKFASYNYVLTLSALSRTQMANPDKILSDTPHDIIARTGGIGNQTAFANETDFGGGDTKDQNVLDEFERTIKKPKFDEAKADLNARRERDRRTPLLVAAELGLRGLVDALVDNGADYNATDSDGKGVEDFLPTLRKERVAREKAAEEADRKRKAAEKEAKRLEAVKKKAADETNLLRMHHPEGSAQGPGKMWDRARAQGPGWFIILDDA